MTSEFDPYYLWLSIPPDSGLRHHYRLLGVSVFETDANVIDAAANRLTTYVKSVSAGDRREIGERVIREIAAARQVLLDPKKRDKYDDSLRTQLSNDSAAAPTGDEPTAETSSPDADSPSDQTADPTPALQQDVNVVASTRTAETTGSTSLAPVPNPDTQSTPSPAQPSALARLLKAWWKELVIYGGATALTLGIVSVLLMSGDGRPVEPTNDASRPALAAEDNVEVTAVHNADEPQTGAIDPHLVGRWSFDEATGARSVDGSGHGHEGEIHGATWTARGDQPALDFDGDDWVDLENPAAMNFPGMITMAAWIQPEATGGFRNILAHGYDSDAMTEVVLRINETTYEVGSWTGENAIVSGGDATADLNTWVHLAGVYDGTHWRLYRNGQEIDSQEHPQGSVELKKSWAIGAMENGTGRHFDGGIDEVLVYSRALSAAEVLRLYESYNKAKTSPPS